MKKIIFKSFALLVAFLGLSFDSSAQTIRTDAKNVTTASQVSVSAAARSQLQNKTNTLSNGGNDQNISVQDDIATARKPKPKPRPFVKMGDGPVFVKCANPPCF
jgi:hypothetical protein